MATRIVLRDDVEAIAKDLQAFTGMPTLTDLVAMIVTRYQDHLRQTWRVQAVTITATPVPTIDTPYYSSTVPQTVPTAPTYHEPITGF